jgi:pantoate--beta-alanine ligase
MSEHETIAALPVVRTVAALRRAVDLWRETGERVGLVPTMGALHRGHLALVARARELSGRVVASLFVNPTQFAPTEDLARYPRDEAADAAKLATAGCDLLYAPGVEEMYPLGSDTTVDPGAIAERLCGPFRPGHFKGVATVVTKLLLQARPDTACFGEKDYQQLQIIRHVVRDLDIPARIEPVATVREPDGLALSSRNAYLSPAERAIAPLLHRTLAQAVERVRAGASPREAEAGARAALLAAGFAKVDYVAVCDAATLAPLEHLDRPARLLAAAWLGGTRLIDNVPLLPDA